MFSRPPAPPTETKPELPRRYSRLETEQYPESGTQQLLALAETGDQSSLTQYASPDEHLLAAIDPSTGDSCLHRAAAAGNIDFMSGIPAAFGRQLSQQPAKERLLWVLLVHQNLEGNTALHAAARAGNLRGVAAVYRLFHLDHLEDDRERGPNSDDPQAEYWDWGPLEDDSYSSLPALSFVCTENRAGRDAASEARAAGHADVATWLDALVARLDRAGMRADRAYMEQARRIALENHWYHDDEKIDKKS